MDDVTQTPRTDSLACTVLQYRTVNIETHKPEVIAPHEKPTNNGSTVKSVQRAIDIIEEIQERDGARVTELASELGVAKRTIHSHLTTLNEAGYLIRDGDEYQIGTIFLRLGEHARTRREEYVMASEKVERIPRQSEERSQFAVEEHGRVVFLYREAGRPAVNTGTEIGRRRYLHTSSAGKVILAYLPEERVQGILVQWGLPKVTENTMATEEELHEVLETMREQKDMRLTTRRT